MADVAALDITIGAKVDGAVQGFNTVQLELFETGEAAKKTDVSFSKLTDTVAKFGGGVRAFTAAKLGDKLKEIPNASNQATQALTNLGRVVQDAPYGFIGIANNINPLLESFQRLKATSGTTGGALKALGSELGGAGGIGIAVSLATSLMVVFGDKLFKTTQAVDTHTETIHATKTAYEEWQASLQGVIEKNAALTKSLEILDKSFGKIVFIKALQPLFEKLAQPLVAAKLALEQYNNSLDKATSTDEEITARTKELTHEIDKQTKFFNQNLTGYQKLAGGAKELFDILDPDKTKKRTEKVKDYLEAELELHRRIYEDMQEIKKLGLAQLFTPSIDLSKLRGGVGGTGLESPMKRQQRLMENLSSSVQGYVDEIDKRLKGQQGTINDVADDLVKVLAPAWDAVFGAVENGENVFDSLGKAITRMVLHLVQAVAMAATLSVIISAIAPLLGISATALKPFKFGALLQTFSGFKFFQQGGITTEMTPAILHPREAVIPLDRLREFIQPANQQAIVLETRIRGNDLYLLQSRTTQRRNRTY
jgi:hypothetical protein